MRMEDRPVPAFVTAVYEFRAEGHERKSSPLAKRVTA